MVYGTYGILCVQYIRFNSLFNDFNFFFGVRTVLCPVHSTFFSIHCSMILIFLFWCTVRMVYGTYGILCAQYVRFNSLFNVFIFFVLVYGTYGILCAQYVCFNSLFNDFNFFWGVRYVRYTVRSVHLFQFIVQWF